MHRVTFSILRQFRFQFQKLNKYLQLLPHPTPPPQNYFPTAVSQDATRWVVRFAPHHDPNVWLRWPELDFIVVHALPHKSKGLGYTFVDRNFTPLLLYFATRRAFVLRLRGARPGGKGERPHLPCSCLQQCMIHMTKSALADKTVPITTKSGRRVTLVNSFCSSPINKCQFESNLRKLFYVHTIKCYLCVLQKW
jgi:hypothetical protein